MILTFRGRWNAAAFPNYFSYTKSGFEWDNFLPRSWQSAVFLSFVMRIMLTTLIFWLLLSNACPKSRTFQFPMLCEWRAAQGARRDHSWDSSTKMAKGLFHTKECHAQYMNHMCACWLRGADCWQIGCPSAGVEHRWPFWGFNTLPLTVSSP